MRLPSSRCRDVAFVTILLLNADVHSGQNPKSLLGCLVEYSEQCPCRAGRATFALLPVADRLVRHVDATRQLHLRQSQAPAHPAGILRHVPHRLGVVLVLLQAKVPFGHLTWRATTCFERWCSLLRKGCVAAVIKELQELHDSGRYTEKQCYDIQGEINYFTANKERMDYPLYRSVGLPIGSGVVDSACKKRGRRAVEAERHDVVAERSEGHAPASGIRPLSRRGTSCSRATTPMGCGTAPPIRQPVAQQPFLDRAIGPGRTGHP